MDTLSKTDILFVLEIESDEISNNKKYDFYIEIENLYGRDVSCCKCSSLRQYSSLVYYSRESYLPNTIKAGALLFGGAPDSLQINN